MKIRPSYKQQAFIPVVIASVTAHVFILSLSGGFLKPAPEYAVINAPSSMEVVLLEEPKVKKIEPILEEEVLTTLESKKEIIQEEKEPVKEKEKQPVEEEAVVEEEEILEHVTSVEEKGAIEESEPEYLRNPAPRYPKYARERRWEGLVMLNVFVDSSGDAVQVDIKMTSGHKLLDKAAVKAVKAWKFKPASLGHVNLSAWIEVPIRFVLG